MRPAPSDRLQQLQRLLRLSLTSCCVATAAVFVSAAAAFDTAYSHGFVPVGGWNNNIKTKVGKSADWPCVCVGVPANGAVMSHLARWRCNLPRAHQAWCGCSWWRGWRCRWPTNLVILLCWRPWCQGNRSSGSRAITSTNVWRWRYSCHDGQGFVQHDAEPIVAVLWHSACHRTTRARAGGWLMFLLCTLSAIVVLGGGRVGTKQGRVK